MKRKSSLPPTAALAIFASLLLVKSYPSFKLNFPTDLRHQAKYRHTRGGKREGKREKSDSSASKTEPKFGVS